MAKLLVNDALWALIEPVIPEHPPRPQGGKPPTPDRVCLTGILFVLKTGIPWEDFPQEMGCCGMTLWNRLRDWQRAGVWQRIHAILLAELRGAERIDFSRAVVDSASIRAVHGGKKTGPSPVDRRKAGSKHHLITDAAGVPLATILTAANVNDVTQLLPLVDAVPQVGGKVGRPRRRPDEVLGDRGYDSNPHRAALRQRHIRPRIARRHTEHGSGLGTLRYVAEQTLALLHQLRRLRTRFEKRDDIHEALMSLGCSVICWRRLNHGYF